VEEVKKKTSGSAMQYRGTMGRAAANAQGAGKEKEMLEGRKG